MHLCTLCSKALQIYNKFPKVENTYQKNYQEDHYSPTTRPYSALTLL